LRLLFLEQAQDAAHDSENETYEPASSGYDAQRGKDQDDDSANGFCSCVVSEVCSYQNQYGEYYGDRPYDLHVDACEDSLSEFIGTKEGEGFAPEDPHHALCQNDQRCDEG